ncbi:type IV inositol polyphosphate 5-phosphatase 3-like [Panicum miliaceum]|uniref:Type IV inositol polyphosphate 5-phosphatase 3-like n=1 Tax=Panicum miliaceum TaxID=4540 RepID=A0A3L6SCL2_PANMI|nr:type IV inositol polyphosphate 5-phosphatase 3-like [Panicum miliaceum]
MTLKGCPPDAQTYNALIKLLTNRNMPDAAARIYKKMIKKGLEPTIHTYNMMMKSYFLGVRNYAMGCAVWEEMHQKVFINGHIQHGRPDEACKYIEEMINKGMKAPQIDYNKFAADFSKAGKPDILYELAQKVEFAGKSDVSNVFHQWAERMKSRIKRTVPNQTGAGYVIGTEDTRPVAVWKHIIHETSNKCPDKSKCHSDSPPPARSDPSDCVLAMKNELFSEFNNDSDGELHLLDNAKSPTSARCLQSLDLASDVNIDDRVKRKRPQYVRLTSRQMVQGSISVSMSVHETHFCFVCCHLTAGEKNGDELKRNADADKILKRTVFSPTGRVGVPQRIYDHERVIWLGDLNYRLNLSYETTHELISKKDWDGVFEKDQLKRELRKGCTFDGWIEGAIRFAPTYKYEFNSEKCDRILSYGKGTRLLSYKRAELTCSDHRPVTAVFISEVEVFVHRKFQRALNFTNAEVEDNLLLGRKEALLKPFNLEAAIS